jgi:hypothetical protein
MRNVLSIAASFFGLVVFACGDDDPGEKYSSADAFCSAKAAEECKAVSAVCAVSDTVCTTRRTDACKTAANAAIAQGRAYRAANAEACINATAAVYADRVINPTKEETFEEACERVFTGSKKASEACSNLYDCEGSLTCDLDKKFCAAEVTRMADQPCNNPGDICATGLYCQDRGGSKFCGAKKNKDEACGAAGPCLEAFRCVNVCVDKVAPGGFCDTNDECTTGLCNAEKRCAARQYPSETGSCKDFGGS